MKIFVVIGVTYNESNDILGVYDSIELAEGREKVLEFDYSDYYDQFKIREFELNKYINPE